MTTPRSRRQQADAGGDPLTRAHDRLTAAVAALVEGDAWRTMLKGAARIVQVSETEIADAMRAYYEDTHNLAEGAGAASLAALMQESSRQRGRRIGLVLSGGNIDRSAFAQVLTGETPAA